MRRLKHQLTPADGGDMLARLLLAIAAGASLTAPGCASSERELSGYPAGGSKAGGGQTSAGGTTSMGAANDGGSPSENTGGESSKAGAPGDGDGDGDGDNASVGGSSAGTGGAPVAMCMDARQEVEFCATVESMEYQAMYGFGMVPLDPPRSEEEVEEGFDANGCMRPDWVADGCCNTGIAPGVPQDDGSCCYIACEGACCGRPLVVDGEVRQAKARARDDWLSESPSEESQAPLTDSSVLGRIALCFRNEALLEHASIASFSRFTLQLLALGAPAELVRLASAAAHDEVNHARRCFSIARHVGGHIEGPGPVPEAQMAMQSSPLDVLSATIIEGCVGETISAALVAEQARIATDSSVRESLQVIAEDEARHAELAWMTAAWLLSASSSPQDAEQRRTAAERAFEEGLKRLPGMEVPSGVSTDMLNHYGRLNKQQAKSVINACAKDVVVSTMQTLLRGGTARRPQDTLRDPCTIGSS